MQEIHKTSYLVLRGLVIPFGILVSVSLVFLGILLYLMAYDLDIQLHNSPGGAMLPEIYPVGKTFLVRIVPLLGGILLIIMMMIGWFWRAARKVARRIDVDHIRLQVSLLEKESLLKEIHHRVKNNLQIISSLMHLQARTVTVADVAALFMDGQNRVQSMAFIHEQLYQNKNFSIVNFKEYTKTLTAHLMEMYTSLDKPIGITLDVKSVDLEMQKAVPCGLIVNELLSNALKHAFPNKGNNSIMIRFSPQTKGGYILVIKDNGIGIQGLNSVEHAGTLGLTLVYELVKQLQGSVFFENTRGLKVTIQFP